MRPSKIENYMAMAKIVAERSHDSETKVGAILVNNKSGAIVATGFNGFVRGTNDENLPSTRPEKYEYILHAEQNLICNCSRHGISMEDTTLICTLSPCKLCMRLMFNSGVTTVVARELYRDFQEILSMKDIKVKCETQEDGFYLITYEANDGKKKAHKDGLNRVKS